MQPHDATPLARRLRNLRLRTWPDVGITQAQIAQALGVSVPAVSSWESETNPKIPPIERLIAYATLFATRRSFDGVRWQVPDDATLTDEERTARDLLRHELLALRDRAMGESDDGGAGGPSTSDAAFSPWRFRNERITMVCAPMPAKYLHPGYTDPDDPNYIETYRYADLDALLELYGYLRALNPESRITMRTPDSVEPHEYTNHLILLGGVDWNELTRELLKRLDVPVTQATRETDESVGFFEVTEGTETVTFRPVMYEAPDRTDTKVLLVEDVAHFFRGPNPFNRRRTVTLCNGMYGRGVLGAVRALTDPTFRQRNADYLATRFSGSDQYSILSRVPVVSGKVLTPDWTVPHTRLHEWPEAGA